MPINSDHNWRQLLQRLDDATPSLRAPGSWPTEQFQWLAQAGVLRRGVPVESGGLDQTAAELLEQYIDLAEACLTTAFVLTQWNAAVQRIVDAEPGSPARADLLPELAAGRLFATVGISHLTTSRQHLGRPAVAVQRRGDALELSGEVPWVTGAAHADVIVTGGVDDQGGQYLLALPTQLPGVTIAPPEELLALSASGTSRVILDGVRVPEDRILAGPMDRVLQRGSGGGTGSLGTSALAAGLSRRAVRLLAHEAARRAELQPATAGLQAEVVGLIGDLFESARGADTVSCGSPESLRERANSLALRSTQALLAASKGAGFVCGHPAEQAVREALFFLVWSCPQPVVAAALRGFACLAE